MRKTWFLILLVLSTAGVDCLRAAQPGGLPRMSDVGPSDSLLVVAPHPDDESLCCGGLIDLARRSGASVSIVWVTAGDGSRVDAIVGGRTLRPGHASYRGIALRRAREARAAADILQVPHDRQFLLAYPDRGILPLTVSFHSSPWRSRRTGKSVVYLEEAVSPGSAYEGGNLERDLAAIIEQVRPTLVLAPSLQDAHPDHRGTGLMAMRVMAARGEADRVRYWIVHGGRGWPAPRGFRPNLPQLPAPRGHGMEWEYVPLDDAAREAKHRAISAHGSQTRVMGRKMSSYVRATELYARAPAPHGDPACVTADSCTILQPAVDEFPLDEEEGP